MTGEHWKEIETRNVSVGNVHVGERILYPTKARVDAMVRSLSGPLGQLQPILVTKHLHSAWRVVAGATRLLAAKELKWKEIRATIISADNDIEYQLIEIAENLDRHDLSENERTRLKKRQKELRAQQIADLEAEQPEKGKPGRGKKGGLADAARKAGVPRSTVRDRLNKSGGNSNPPDLGDAPSNDPAPKPPPKNPEPPQPGLVQCPRCHGTGTVPVVAEVA